MKRQVTRSLSLVAALVLSQAAAARGQLQAGPTLVDIAPGLTAGRMTLANSGDQPVSAQLRVFRWTQVDGEDRLAPTQEVVLSPAITKIEAGAEQVVRVVRQGAAPAGKDATYRIIVDELPPPAEQQETGINFRMRFVVPVYLRAAQAKEPSLTCELRMATLTCTNSGGQAAQLGATRLIDAKGSLVALSRGLFGYVLPGSSRKWPLESGFVTTLTAELRLETQLNGQPAAIPVIRAP
ncbi:molecular chaperone [Lysobacter arenosi]|uniref:Molecular chaperone n=1 Tax=Lysobacter arenosi TaxID=2795387 RepID=A0ABX7R7S9_9GAMM|nr:fimbria/pilus periplasmic chaperone [Lysobacter arenosi]QSX74167.1 molecular chaperone [Lysobacter arenosi]